MRRNGARRVLRRLRRDNGPLLPATGRARGSTCAAPVIPACAVRRSEPTRLPPRESASRPAGRRPPSAVDSGRPRPAPRRRTGDRLGAQLASPSPTRPLGAACSGCDTIKPRGRVRAGQGLFQASAPSAGFEPAQAEPTVQDTARLQRLGDLGVRGMTCDFGWWQETGSNRRRPEPTVLQATAAMVDPALVTCDGACGIGSCWSAIPRISHAARPGLGPLALRYSGPTRWQSGVKS